MSSEDQNNLSEMMLCRVSDNITQIQGWNFLVPQHYTMMDTSFAGFVALNGFIGILSVWHTKSDFWRLVQLEK